MSPRERFKSIRKELNMTQNSFGESLKLKQTQIKDIESGKQKVSIDIAQKIEDVFGVDAAWIIFGKGEKYLTKEESSDEYIITLLSQKVSAGYGEMNLVIENTSTVGISKRFFKTPPKLNSLKALQVAGDSMFPTLCDGDFVMIEETKTFSTDGLYVINKGDELYVKRLVLNLRNEIEIISDNKNYPSYIIPYETQEINFIIGKVILRIQR